ncbi:MAG: flippase-like domain-containing protein [Candidatus Methanomethyliaceae archaeon]|nr:flippase-like domain-containing protein [Candidatus Methanomethyliaceae archaeon]MDW7970869.1 lysylphosphatidylglycerol synthase transmembrane domain-containing protein [Nitrososphaerota archaeon]
MKISATSIMLIIGMIIFAIYINAVGIGSLIAEITSINIFVLIIAILIDILCIGLFTLSWYVFLGNPGMKFRKCFEIVLVSIFGDLMIPTASISGEFLRISLTAKRGEISISKAFTSVILHRIVLALTFGLILLMSSILLLSQNLIGSYTLFTIAIVDIFIIVSSICAVKKFYKLRKLIERVVLKIGRILKRFRPDYNMESLKNKISINFERIEMCFSNFRLNTFTFSFIILTLRWFLIAMIPYIMFISLGYEISYWIVLSVSALMSMVQMIPVGIPGMIGIMEVSTTAFFISFGISPSMAASVTILMRVVTFWFELFLGAMAASIQGIRGLKGLSNSMQS